MATQDKDFKVKNGLQVGGPTNLVNYSSSSPSNPFLGQLWINETYLYAWSSASTWVLVGDGTASGGGPGGDYLTPAAASALYFPISSSVSNFGTIKTIPATENVVADLITDELTFAAENGIIINATASADQLTISTNATWNNTASAIVMRDGEESFDITRIDFKTTQEPGFLEPGQLEWNLEEGTLDLGMSGSVVQSIGMEFYMPPVKNQSGQTINNGNFVMATGAQGDRILIAKAITNGSVDPQYMIGVAAQDIPDGSEYGLIAVDGIVRDINTASWVVGTILYPDPNTPGGFTNVQPSAPAVKTSIAIVLRQNAITGRIYVRMDNGSILGGTDSNVQFSTLADNQIITYNQSASYWENQGLAAAIQEVDGAGSGIDSDLLDGEQGSYYLDWNNTTNKPDPIIGVQLTGNTTAAASVTLTDLTNGQLSLVTNTSFATAASSMNWSGVTSKPSPIVGVNLTGDVTGAASATLTSLGNGQISIATTVAPNSVALGTDTAGNYVAALTAGNGISITGTAGEGWSPTVAINSATASVTFANITSKPTTLSGYGITDALPTSASSNFAPLTILINTITTASYGLVASDAGELIEMNSGSANTIVIPLNSSVPFPIGTTIDIIQIGAGQTTASAVSGVTLNSAGGRFRLTEQWSAATLIKRGEDSWILIGDLSA